MAYSSYISATLTLADRVLCLHAPSLPGGRYRVWCGHQVLGELSSHQLRETVSLSAAYHPELPQLVRLEQIGGSLTLESRLWIRDPALLPSVSDMLWSAPQHGASLCVLTTPAKLSKLGAMAELAQAGFMGCGSLMLIILDDGGNAAAFPTFPPFELKRQIVISATASPKTTARAVEQALQYYPAALCVPLSPAAATVAAFIEDTPVVSSPWTALIRGPRNGVLDIVQSGPHPYMSSTGGKLKIRFDRHDQVQTTAALAVIDDWISPLPSHARETAMADHDAADLLQRAREIAPGKPVTLLHDGNPRLDMLAEKEGGSVRFMALRNWVCGQARGGQRIADFDPERLKTDCVINPCSNPDTDAFIHLMASASGTDYVSSFRLKRSSDAAPMRKNKGH